MAEPEQDFSSLPLEERFVHKVWKVRKEAYEAAAKDFAVSPDECAPVFSAFHQSPELWKGAAADSNVAAQVEGLAALCAYLKHGGALAASRSRPHTLQAITDKALASTRPAAKQHAVEALLLYVENDKPDLVLDDLLPALSHKQPKVAAASLAAVTTIYHHFGTRVVDPKPVLKQLPKAFGHADKNIRAEAQCLAVELYRWHRDAIKTHFWADLKPVQQTELEKLFDKVKDEPPAQQERFTRAQQAQQAAAAAAAAANPDAAADGQPGAGHDEDGGNDADGVQDDAFDLAEPVDVVAKTPADWYEMIASTKWKERKDSLDALLAVLDTPRIKDGPVDDMVRALAKCMKDANVAVVTVAAHCIEKLALGMRKAFAKHRSAVLEPMLDRLKEKKQSVTDALAAALDAVFQSSSMSDCLESTVGFLTHKNPNVKAETAKFLVRCLCTTRDVPSKPEQKQIADAGTRMLTESTEQMRAVGAQVLGTLMKILGERAMNPYLDGLDDMRKNKIKEYFDTAQVRAKERPKPVVAPPAPRGVAASAVGKKVVGGAKKPGLKKLAPAAAAPAPLSDDEPLKPAPKPLSKPGASKSSLAAPNGPKLGTLKRPGLGSPQPRKLVSPLSLPSDDDHPAPSPSSKFGAGRGLTSKPLGRPGLQSKSPPPVLAAQPPALSALSTIQLAELEELRAEKERLTTLADSLRSSNTKLLAEISELQNQNAQLIEDHTRDVLQIKAKETQLTRARGESDVLRAEMDSLKKEAERYKRELSRLGRQSLGRDRDDLRRSRLDDTYDIPTITTANSNSNGYSTTNGNGCYANSALYDDVRPSSTSRPISSTALHRTGSTASAASARSGLSGTTQPLRSQNPYPASNLSPADEKENHNTVDALAARRKISPPATSASSRPAANTGFAYASAPSPVRPTPMSRESSAPGSHAGGGNDSGGDARDHGTSGKPENWKRAAEVTSQLKARIEAMKARQGLQQRY